jgi:hypothetical protein
MFQLPTKDVYPPVLEVHTCMPLPFISIHYNSIVLAIFAHILMHYQVLQIINGVRNIVQT